MKNQTTQLNTRKITVLALLLVCAIIGFLIEAAFPPLFPYMPYAKLGVANIFIMLAIYIFGFSEGVLVAIGKLLLAAMITGNIYGCLYSACGLTLSLISLYIMFKLSIIKTTTFGKSVVSSVFFNVGQLIFASVAVSQSLFSILPIMLFCSIISGGIIGVAIKLAVRYIPTSVFLKLQ